MEAKLKNQNFMQRDRSSNDQNSENLFDPQ